ncbi:aspartate ammonia-lyase [Sporosarcina cyprini]|uniref:aspartate ammonia-lyase n=1 Tax=Sporosarcina cyprini TaxID=2910523 RepID=UPI001EE0F15B|nr:aspartate ammonia-lyase [Sporosarcina cyprini]
MEEKQREAVIIEERVERDFLGERNLPKDAYYGIQSLRALENFPITHERIHPQLIRALGMVKKAAAEANHEVNGLPADKCKAIVEAAQEVMDGRFDDQFIVDPIQGGAGTSINMNANEVIANRALELLGHPKGDYGIISPNNHVNMSQSTNDAFPTAVKIAVHQLLNELIDSIGYLVEELQTKEAQFDTIIKMGRTHLQDAVPIRLGQEFGAYKRVVERDLKRIRQARLHLEEINMGATAVGTGLNASVRYIQRVTEQLCQSSGFPLRTAEHLVDATQNTDCYTEISAALKICMLNLSKMANDLRLMASGPRTGFNEINLPARQPGSSIMPGKVNPVMAEVLNQIAFQVIGNDHTISLASEAGQFELNVMEPVLVYNLLQSITVMKNGIDVFRRYCLAGITANEEQLRSNVENSIGILTALIPAIGYETSSQIAREAFATGVPVRELCLKYDVGSAEDVDRLLRPYPMTVLQGEL